MTLLWMLPCPLQKFPSPESLLQFRGVGTCIFTYQPVSCNSFLMNPAITRWFLLLGSSDQDLGQPHANSLPPCPPVNFQGSFGPTNFTRVGISNRAALSSAILSALALLHSSARPAAPWGPSNSRTLQQACQSPAEACSL